ncbi:MAG TPA: uracil-DNA glycosylase [Mycobacteriales bacterium]|nr:uracil-DNA glycosylase [Mycobacteriales bacterium]
MPVDATDDVAKAAHAARTLTDLVAAMRGCTACAGLAAQRRSVVVGDFPERRPRLMLVGEAPGAQEDATGRPFVGRAGQLLDALLAEAGLDRASVAVANVVKCRPPNNRPPTRREAKQCSGWLDRQVALVDPALVVTLGGTALAWALGPGTRLRDARGVVHAWRDRRLIATYHPSAAIRFGPNGEPMAALRADLHRVREVLCSS